jgi:nucleoside-diphosphate-sugar epimerase
MAIFLVTGAAGFIGSKVCEFLLADGHAVSGIDNLNDAYDVRLKQWRLSRLRGNPKFQFFQFDITDVSVMRTLFEGGRTYDGVINLAARAGVRQSVAYPAIYYETNVTGTLNLLELCREYDVKKFVLASSSSLYGAKNPRPFREDANTDYPFSPYAASKKAAETLCYTYHYLHGLDVTVLRYFTVYGPAGRPDMSAFRFVQWICEGRPVMVYGDGKQSRDFTYVDDIAVGTIAALRPLGYQVINLGSDRPIEVREVICLLEELISKEAQIGFKRAHPADVPATWADIRRAEQLLDWRPQYSFRKGLAQLVAWYQENREWASTIATD